MRKNGVAQILCAIGIIEVLCGLVVSIILFAEKESTTTILGVAMLIASIVNCMLLIGFGEVINLLQKNVDRQNMILDHLKGRQDHALKDIESNLPMI